MGKFVIKNTTTGVKFDLKADNGHVIASSQIYKSREACLAGVESVKENAPVAEIEDQTAIEFIEQKCPKFEAYLDKELGYRFRLKAANGQIIAVSGNYANLDSCKKGIESVRENVSFASVEDKEG